MDDRFRRIAALAATQHSVISICQFAENGVDTSLRSKWERRGLIYRMGSRSFAVSGSPPSFTQSLAGGLADLGDFGLVAGRAGARLYMLDGFALGTPEYLLDRPAWMIGQLRKGLAMLA
jgi:hypothetical protein